MAADLKQNLVVCLVIHPILFLINIIDFIIGLIVPNKYDDETLPDRDSILTELTDKSDPGSAYRSTIFPELMVLDDPNINVYKQFEVSAKKYANVKTIGVREVFSIEDEKQPNGKSFKKYSLGEYKWTTYSRMYERVNDLSNGLLNIDLKSEMNVVLFSETRAEWLMSAFACFRIKAPVVTLYATLGIEALAFGINQTKSKYLITSSDSLPKIMTILDKIQNVTNIIVFTDKFSEKIVNDFKKKASGIKVHTFDEVESLGSNSKKIENFKSPKKDDLALIMYTSGSTGNPKGVMISHGNLCLSVKGESTRLGKIISGEDVFVAFLPLAHILELICELFCVFNGATIGYSSPITITDTSTGIKKNEKGDLKVLEPTIMAGVPIVLERIMKAVFEKVGQSGWFKESLFKIAYQQKLRRFRRGQSTRLLDSILFKKISHAILGKKVRLVIAGGAMLSREVQEFVQVIICPVMQAFGLTETCGAGTTTFPNQVIPNVVGSLVPCGELRLVDWEEGGYRNTDPNPRGEIYLGGENITMGYYEMPEKTAEDYKVINGIKYFCTGDIGEMLPGGNLKIIDRKKDLVKLQGGEYISLNKVESILKLLPMVDNCCLLADCLKSYTVLICSANQKKLLEKLKNEDGIDHSDKSFKEIINLVENNKVLMKKINEEVLAHCLKQGLQRFEVPTKIKFVEDTWVPESGLVTPSQKIVRREINKFYKDEIEILYK